MHKSKKSALKATFINQHKHMLIMPSVLQDAFVLLKEVVLKIVNRFIIAAVILLTGFIMGRIAFNLSKRILSEIKLDILVRSYTGIKLSMEETISNIIKYSIYFVALLFSVSQLGIENLTFNVIATGVLILIIISVILAVRDFFPNLLARLFIRSKRDFKPGNLVRTENAMGRLVSVDLVETKIEVKSGEFLYLPNSFVLRGIVRVKRRREKKDN